MKVTVTLIPGNHPEYLTELINSSNQELLWKFQARFNNYRDLANLVEKYSSNVMNGVVFPPTYSYSSYGFKLSNIQLVERKELLEQVCQNLVTHNLLISLSGCSNLLISLMNSIKILF